MSDIDMWHMVFIATVADEDIQHLRKKEQTYKGSWKKRGGIGAFMMLARKWDRIENIVGAGSDPNLKGGYDIFYHIERNSSGLDGSVLAEIRDLRRYLILIEAEMMARGVVVQNETEDTSLHGLEKKLHDQKLYQEFLPGGFDTPVRREYYIQVENADSMGAGWLLDRRKTTQRMHPLQDHVNSVEYAEMLWYHRVLYERNGDQGWKIKDEFREAWTR